MEGQNLRLVNLKSLEEEDCRAFSRFSAKKYRSSGLAVNPKLELCTVISTDWWKDLKENKKEISQIDKM